MNLPPYDRDAAQVLLKEKPGAPFSAYDTATRAHRRSDLKREDEAALLFCLAAERAEAEHVAEVQAKSGDELRRARRHRL